MSRMATQVAGVVDILRVLGETSAELGIYSYSWL